MNITVNSITLYGFPRRQKERQPDLLLCRHHWPRQWQVPRGQANLSRHRRAPRKARSGQSRPSPTPSLRSRPWPVRHPLAGRRPQRAFDTLLKLWPKPRSGPARPTTRCSPQFTAFLPPGPKPPSPTGIGAPSCARCGASPPSASARKTFLGSNVNVVFAGQPATGKKARRIPQFGLRGRSALGAPSGAGIPPRPACPSPVPASGQRWAPGPSWPSRVPGWRVHATDRASRVAAVSLLRACRRHYPGGNDRCPRRSLPSRWQPSSCLRRVGSRIACFEVCSAFTRVTACPLAESLNGDPLTSGCFNPCCYPHESPRLLPAGTTVAGRALHPLGFSAFRRRT